MTRAFPDFMTQKKDLLLLQNIASYLLLACGVIYVISVRYHPFILLYHICVFCPCLIVESFRISLCLVVDIVVASCLSDCISRENDSSIAYLIVSFELK